MSPLNSYFLQGSPSEQRLVQDLINEQLKMYGQDVLYMPRKIVGENNVIKEITASKFDDSYRIEAYLMNSDGFSGNGELLSKFGIRNSDEINLVISKERYTDFIIPKLARFAVDERKNASRPQEGDLIWFPLDQSLFEIKYVEGKKPFYQLQELYVYELRCERFEFEDEVINVDVTDESGLNINESVKDFGNIYNIQMVGSAATTAVATVGLITSDPTSKSVQYIDLINDGFGYSSPPRVSISTAPIGGLTATAVAIMTSRSANQKLSIDKILVTNPGFGYTEPPTVTIVGGSGQGGIATAVISSGVLGIIGISSGGVGYTTTPQVFIDRIFIPSSSGISSNINNAQAEAIINVNGEVSQIRYLNAGAGYTSAPSITFTSPVSDTFGDYTYNQLVSGTNSGTTGYVKSWDHINRVLKLSTVNGTFQLGESIVGTGVSYKISTIETNQFLDEYASNDDIESEADSILDFSQRNPFGEF
jgi:hypothetical protein